MVTILNMCHSLPFLLLAISDVSVNVLEVMCIVMFDIDMKISILVSIFSNQKFRAITLSGWEYHFGDKRYQERQQNFSRIIHKPMYSISNQS